MKTKPVRPFGFRDELGYVFGDMAGSFVNLFVDAYFLTFCTYVLGISPAWMAGLFLAARPVGCHQRPHHGFFPRPLAHRQNGRQVQALDQDLYAPSGTVRRAVLCQCSL